MYAFVVKDTNDYDHTVRTFLLFCVVIQALVYHTWVVCSIGSDDLFKEYIDSIS